MKRTMQSKTGMNNVTEFGYVLRQIRLDQGELLKDMANRIGVEPSYLSRIERGGRNAPMSWLHKIVNEYQLSDTIADTLKRAIINSRTFDRLDIKHLKYEDKQLVYHLVKSLPDMKVNQRNRIKEDIDTLMN